jgi:hypothetical protein
LKIVLNVARAIKIFLLLVLLLSLSFGCYKATDEDRAKLKELEVKFGDRYKFSLTSDGTYIHAKLKKDATLQKNDDEEMYKLFIFKNFEKEERRNTPYAYLNLYDAKGNFLHQIYYDSKAHKFGREYKREHY